MRWDESGNASCDASGETNSQGVGYKRIVTGRLGCSLGGAGKRSKS